MFTVQTTLTIDNKSEISLKSIIDSCCMFKTKSGYQVIIDLSERWPTVEYTSSGSDGEVGIAFSIDKPEYEGYIFSVDWQTPYGLDHHSMSEHREIEKDQIVISFVDTNLLIQHGPITHSYESPMFRIMATMRLLELAR